MEGWSFGLGLKFTRLLSERLGFRYEGVAMAYTVYEHPML